ncbi:MAG TPA: ABC transporter permease [Gemmataceae bacterium]|jgi:ABC-type transport system involved in multi-copper enzyme maturation permease subunit|nr:ABC transporter permease [Gemmataceae bacterium]
MSSKPTSDTPSLSGTSRGWNPSTELAPSIMRNEDPRFARLIGLIGLSLVLFGAFVLMLIVFSNRVALSVSPGWGIMAVVTGVTLLLFHAALDPDMQIRRTYGLLGYFWLMAALLFIVIPKPYVGALFLPYSFVCLVLGLLFLMPFVRNETDPSWRVSALAVIGGLGALMALVGFVGGIFYQDFLVGGDAGRPYGVLLILAGLGYSWVFLTMEGVNSKRGHRAALGLGLLGLLVMLVALGRSILPSWFFAWGWLSNRPTPYFVPVGLTLFFLGFLFASLSACLCLDYKFFVLFRRELTSFFYSPIAYLVLLSFTIVAAVLFLLFIRDLARPALLGIPVQEPIVTQYLLSLFPVCCFILAVPLLSMRLLSEENRTGSLEVLLTAPLDETVVVMSKLFAALVFFMLLWLPWGLCLISLRVEGGQPFEYRPLLIFYLMLAVSGASFLSMGLFFSSLTRNQIIAAVMSVTGMLLFFVVFFIEQQFMSQRDAVSGQALVPILNHISFIDLWFVSLEGEITPKYYLYQISATIFWSFLTVKVLESRRWR